MESPNLQPPYEFNQVLASEPSAPPGEDRWPGGTGERGGGSRDLVGVEGCCGGVIRNPGGRCSVRIGDAGAADVVGNSKDHGHAGRPGERDGPLRLALRVRPVHGDRGGADRGGEGGLVDVPVPHSRLRGGADDHDEGDARAHRLGERGDEVGETSPVGRGGRGQPPAGAKVGVGGGDGGRLVTHGSEDRGRGLQSVEEVGVAVAHHSEDVVDMG